MLKRFLITFLMLLLPIFSISAVIYYQSVNYNKLLLEKKSIANLNKQNEQIINEFTYILSDLTFLAEQRQLQVSLDKDNKEHWQILAEEYRLFITRKKLYDQIRFLNETGMEVVRVNFNTPVPSQKLQLQSKRYYFRDTFILGRGEIFVSPLDLNIEKGEIERPKKPVIRFGTPVFDSNGQKKDILLLNYLGSKLLKKWDHKGVNTSNHIVLLNAAGFWLKGIVPEDEWGFMYKDSNNRTFENRFPAEWQRIIQKQSDQFYTSNGLFTFITIYPLSESPKQGTQNYYWKMVSHASPQTLQAKSNQILRDMALPFIALIILMFIVSTFLTRIKIKHTEFLQNVIDSLDHPFHVINTNNYQIELANAATRALGIKPQVTCYALTHKRNEPCTGIKDPCPLKEVLKTKEPVMVEHLHFDKDGKPINVEVHGFPIHDSAGKINQMIEYALDITERKRAEKQLHKQNQELQVKNEQLDALASQLKVQQNKLYQINAAYQRFVPCEFLSLLEKQSILDVQLGNQIKKEMSILFCDIRDFTALSEKITPQDNFDFINAFLGRMAPIIDQHHGVIDKYIGDEIMALFPTHADDAVQAAINMLKALADYNLTRGRPERPKLKMGIGINTGLLMLGIVGGKNRMDGTVISDAVNLASRVEEMNKKYGTSLLITTETYQKLKEPSQYKIRLIDTVKVKGKSKVVTIYEVFDTDSPSMMANKSETLSDFKQGVMLYHKTALKKAKIFFERVLKINPDDKVAQIYLKRCDHFQKIGIPDDWAL